LPSLMPHKQWMKLTEVSRFSIRSSSLKKLDASILAHEKTPNPQTLQTVRMSLITWMSEKGSAWQTSDRNKYGAVETLYKQIHNVAPMKKMDGDDEALEIIAREQEEQMDKLFLHEKLVLRASTLQKILGREEVTSMQKISLGNQVRSTVKNVDKIHKALEAPKNASDASNGILHGLLEPVAAHLRDEVHHVLQEIMPHVLANLLTEVTPFLGVITSGVSAVTAYGKLAKAEYNSYQSEVHRARMLVVDNPARALESITVMFDREVKNQAVLAGINTVAFGTKAAACFLDFGTASNAVIGLATTIAKLANAIIHIWADVAEKNEGNLLMMNKVTADIFGKVPIIGAYYVCCVPTSVLVNAALPRMFEHGFRGTIDRNVEKHVTPMRDAARKMIREYRFIIPKLQTYPGVMMKNDDELKKMQKNMNLKRTDNVSYTI
jgi:hypothetical protein